MTKANTQTLEEINDGENNISEEELKLMNQEDSQNLTKISHLTGAIKPSSASSLALRNVHQI